MLSQLTKTIKLALKSTEEERAILRARSAVQRFPVVEWRQRMEDFHKRSIMTSRGIAGANAWRESDCDGGTMQPVADTEDWNPVVQVHPTQPDWDARSVDRTPGTPGSQETLNTGDYLTAPRPFHDSQRSSIESADGSEYNIHSPSSTITPQEGYSGFLDKANRTIARDQKHAPDPFLDPSSALIPNRPFGSHSRASSVESIASIVDEKSNSPLNKAIASVSKYAPGLIASKLNWVLRSSSLMPTGVFRQNLCRNCRCSVRITQRANYQSRSS
jgi:alpha-1,3-glucan synthase